MDNARNWDARVRCNVSHGCDLAGHLRTKSFGILYGPTIHWSIWQANNENSVNGIVEVKKTNNIITTRKLITPS
jgi:hypothetical protein